MSFVIFYGKPGCISNARQVALLKRLGHDVEVRDLLSEGWSPQRLRGFLLALPVAGWFNPNAPAVRDGEILPASFSATEALAVLVERPLLIRRPLIETGFGRCAGFEPGPVLEALGVALNDDVDPEACSSPQGVCP